MDTISIVFEDNSRVFLPDISYDKFTDFLFTEGSSDIEYENYKKRNSMKELCDLNSDTIKSITLEVKDGNGRTLKFKCIYDSDDS